MTHTTGPSCTRRHLLTGAGALLLLTGCTGAPSTGTPAPPTVFDTALAIPPLAPSHVGPDGTRVFELTAQKGTTAFRPGVQSATWGFNGAFLGPTLRAERGEQVAVAVTNALDEPTTVHWHGMRLPAAMDGGPHQEIAPGRTWRPTWRIDQPAATLWYHPHPHGHTEEHVYRGLAGLFLIDDPADAPDLPSAYGVDDLPVIVQDKQFDDDGQLTLDNNRAEPGLLGFTVMANGTIGAYQDITTERIRLRLLNGSTARTYDFGLADDRPFHLVGTDGGLLAKPYETTRVRLSPAERAEIVVALVAGEHIVLRSFPPDLGNVASSTAFGGTDTFDVLQLRAAPTLRSSPPAPAALADLDRLREADATVVREFALASRLINGARMDMDRIDEIVTAGATEIWQVHSIDRLPHNFHIHDVQFQVLSIDGAPPPPELGGRKDTIYLEPGRTYRLIMRFGEYADPRTPYMYHCHLLRHEDEGLMGQFVVVSPDGPPPSASAAPGHHH